MRIYINGRPADVASGADALTALRAHDAELAAQVERGAAYLTDGRAIRVDAEAPLASGDILRVITNSRRGGEGADADA